MKVLVIGSGGREHALAWQAARDPGVACVYVAPGNAGTALEPGVENIAIDVMDLDGLLTFAREEAMDLTLVGPEAPLVAGIVDLFEAEGLPIFGPSAAAAQLEGSKAFTKDFLARHQIPTAAYQSFSTLEPALDYLRQRGAPIVVKADGLAAGKGVIVAEALEDAESAVRDMLSGNAFGEAGCRVVIEDFLQGEEASYIVLVDGEDILPLATSQDHKRIGDGDTGPNTGGMGAYSPAPLVTPEVEARILDQVIRPTVRAMAAEGRPYRGFLYAGLMITPAGLPQVIEYNCRLGDPEAQPLLLRLQSSLVAHCEAAIQGRLAEERARWDPRPAVGVVLAARGYPGAYSKGCPLQLPAELAEDQRLFHAGTAEHEGCLVTSGGRVLCATALGDSIGQARQAAYELVDRIEAPDLIHRRDIGHRALKADSGDS